MSDARLTHHRLTSFVFAVVCRSPGAASRLGNKSSQHAPLLLQFRGYFAKLKQARKPPEQRKLKVDAAASRRFIDNALSGDNVWKSARGQLRREQGGRRTEEGIGRSMPAGQPEGFRYHQGDDRKNREVVSASSSSLSPSLPTPGAPATSLLRGNVGKRRHATDSGKNDEDDSVGTLGKRKKQLRGGADGVGGSRGDDGSREPDEKAKHDGPLVGAGGNHRSTQGASSKLATTAGVGDPTAAGVGPSRKTQCDHQRRK